MHEIGFLSIATRDKDELGELNDVASQLSYLPTRRPTNQPTNLPTYLLTLVIGRATLPPLPVWNVYPLRGHGGKSKAQAKASSYSYSSSLFPGKVHTTFILVAAQHQHQHRLHQQQQQVPPSISIKHQSSITRLIGLFIGIRIRRGLGRSTIIHQYPLR
jgi:hypothetical protein